MKLALRALLTDLPHESIHSPGKPQRVWIARRQRTHHRVRQHIDV